MRFGLALAIILIAGILVAGGAWAFVSASANISKENAYVVLHPPTGKALTSKENAYAVLHPPTGQAFISKENAYAVVHLPCCQVLVSKVNLYAVVSPAIPTIMILN